MSLLPKLASLCSDLAWNRLPPDAATALAGARLIPIGKKGGGVRPIAVGDLLRRLTAKVLLHRYQGDSLAYLMPTQVGVGVRAGAELVIHKVRSWCKNARLDEAMLQLDFQNASNSADRGAMLAAIAQRCPMFHPFAKACYSHHSCLFGSGFNISSELAEHQVCPCGPLFF